MPTQQPDQSTLCRLLDLGRCGDTDGACAEILTSLRTNSFVRGIHPFQDFEWLRNLSWQDACTIVKAVVRLEAARLTKSGGSVSAVKTAFQTIEAIDPVKAMELAAWIVDHSDNAYIPFPMRKIRHAFAQIRRTAGSWADCREQLDLWQSAERARQRRVADEIANQKPEGQRRRQIHKAVAARLEAEQTEIQHARALVREKLLTELRALPVGERLEHIAWDDSRSLSCYPADFAACTKEDFDRLDPVTRDRLAAKIRDRKKGPWRKLAAQLKLR